MSTPRLRQSGKITNLFTHNAMAPSIGKGERVKASPLIQCHLHNAITGMWMGNTKKFVFKRFSIFPCIHKTAAKRLTINLSIFSPSTRSHLLPKKNGVALHYRRLGNSYQHSNQSSSHLLKQCAAHCLSRIKYVL